MSYTIFCRGVVSKVVVVATQDWNGIHSPNLNYIAQLGVSLRNSRAYIKYINFVFMYLFAIEWVAYLCWTNSLT